MFIKHHHLTSSVPRPLTPCHLAEQTALSSYITFIIVLKKLAMLKAMMVLVITLKRIIILREDNGDVYDDGYFQLFMHGHLTGQFRENLVWFEVKPAGSHELHQNLQLLRGAIAPIIDHLY